VTGHGVVRSEMTPGCPETIDLAFWHYVWTFNAAQRPRMLAYFSALRADQRLVTFTARSQATEFLARVEAA
jgi:hypothetical protein